MTDIEIEKRLKDHKNEIKKMLVDHHNQRAALRKEVVDLEARLEQQANAFHQGVASRVQMIHQGLNRAEGRLNAFWNTEQALFLLVERMTCGFYDLIVGPPVGSDPHVRHPAPKFSWTKEEFVAALKDCGEHLYNEATGHEKAELARMRAEKAEGKKVTPLHVRDNLPASAEVLMQNGMLIEKNFAENGSDMKELSQLREEAKDGQD